MMRKDEKMSRFVPANRLLVDTLKTTALAAVIGLAVGLAPLGTAPALAESKGQDTAHLVIKGNSFGATRDVRLSVNKSMILDMPVDAKEVIVSQPGVATAILRSKRRAILQGMSEGRTNIIFLDAAGRTISVLNLQVAPEQSPLAAALQESLARVLPGSNIQVETLSNNAIENKTYFLLKGTVQTAEDKAIAESMANQLSDGGDGKSGSLIEVVGPQQVMLKVTVAEVQRNVAKQLGINLASTFSVAGVTGSFNANTEMRAPGGVEAKFPNNPFFNGSIDVELRALETRGAVRTLAEPVLTAMSGQPANFLAGGELPYATVDDENRRVVVFKPYGVQLDFTPVIKSNGDIELTVKSSVSEPGDQGAISRRDVSTTVVLGAGQTLSIAGMLSERSRHDIKRLPGLGDIPILGALFRSRDYGTQRTELVFLVTPYYARALKQTPELPTDNMTMASDAEAIFLGNIEKIYGVGPGGMRGSYDGSIGFLLD
jgi:pilus assembly protein CpaC